MRFSNVYRRLLTQLLRVDTYTERNERTGAFVKVLRSGCSFTLDVSDNILPTMGLRRAYPHVAAAELAWFLSGERHLAWLNRHAPKIWSKFVEDGTDVVANAYGWRWRRHFNRDQIYGAVTALRTNKTDRRVYVCAWDPSQDGLGEPSKNVPCPVGFSVYTLGDEVHLSVFLRSLDTFVGLPYDVMDFALLLKAFASELLLMPGTLRLTAAHAHLYDKHWEMAGECLEQSVVEPAFPMPHTSVLEIPMDREGYVQDMKSEAKLHKWPEYAPRPEVIE